MFSLESGKSPVDYLKEYGLYAKDAADRAYVKSTKMLEPVHLNKVKLSFRMKQDEEQECGETSMRLINSETYHP